jgi:hypothetical protein
MSISGINNSSKLLKNKIVYLRDLNIYFIELYKYLGI